VDRGADDRERLTARKGANEMSDEAKPGSAPKEGAPPATKPAEAKPSETKPAEMRPTATTPRPVGRLAAQVAFYLGLLSAVAGILVRYVFPGHLAIGPRTFGAAAALCFLVSIALLLAEIERKIGER
jgi:hypothetical protein